MVEPVRAEVMVGSPSMRGLHIQGKRPTEVKVLFTKELIEKSTYDNIHKWIDDCLFPAMDIYFTKGFMEYIKPPLGIQPLFLILEDALKGISDAMVRNIEVGNWKRAEYLVRQAIKVKDLMDNTKLEWEEFLKHGN